MAAIGLALVLLSVSCAQNTAVLTSDVHGHNLLIDLVRLVDNISGRLYILRCCSICVLHCLWPAALDK